MTRRKLLIGGGAAIVSAGGVFLASHHRLRVTRHEVPWRTRRRVRVAHLTDVHVGWSTPPAMLAAAVEATIEARPDLVVLTGDYVNHSLTHASRLEAFVRALPGPKLATLGNHDHWTDAKAIAELLTRAGAKVLVNGRAEAAGVSVVGIDDSVTHHHDVEAAFAGAPDADHLVLSHSPGIAVPIVEQGGARLILSGHTHGGQVRVPVLTAAVARRRGMPFLSGSTAVDDALLYVNAGLGHTRRGLRYGRGTAPELALFDLVPRANA
ncbi:MAG: metallophosphoesterase [Deltaproteobacteria bacterium]|jgi:predicted MPP superfamily phosphohydrolase